MYTRIKRWLEPPVFPGDEEKTNRARIMNTVGLYLALALIITAVVLVPLFAKCWVANFAISEIWRQT